MQQQTVALIASVVRDAGGWISGASLEVPRPACARCDDWTTVFTGPVLHACPVCCFDEYEAWRLGRQGPASALRRATPRQEGEELQ